MLMQVNNEVIASLIHNLTGKHQIWAAFARKHCYSRFGNIAFLAMLLLHIEDNLLAFFAGSMPK